MHHLGGYYYVTNLVCRHLEGMLSRLEIVTQLVLTEKYARGDHEQLSVSYIQPPSNSATQFEDAFLSVVSVVKD